MLILCLEGLRNQPVTLSDGSTGEFVWDDGINQTSYFKSDQLVHPGFEVPRFKIKDGAIIHVTNDNLVYKIKLID